MYGVIIFIIVILIYFFFAMASPEDTNDKIKESRDKIEEILQNKGFKTSKRLECQNKNQLRVDLQNKQIALCEIEPIKRVDIIKFTDIIECEIIEDSNTIMKGGIGRAVVGNAIAGGVGAIVGATTRKSKNVINSLQIRIITKNISKSLYTIRLITTEISKDSSIYNESMFFANNVYATITSIINDNNNTKNLNIDGKKDMLQNNNDFIEQLERLSKLKKEALITDKEFEEGKQKILATKDTNGIDTEISNVKEEISFNDDPYNIEDKIEMYGNNKIKIIKAICAETGVDLKRGNEIFDSYMNNKKCNV